VLRASLAAPVTVWRTTGPSPAAAGAAALTLPAAAAMPARCRREAAEPGVPIGARRQQTVNEAPRREGPLAEWRERSMRLGARGSRRQEPQRVFLI
jgi:hypothetical protein